MWPFLEVLGWYVPTYNALLASGVLVGCGVLLLAVRRKRMNLAFLADHIVLIGIVAILFARATEILIRGYPLEQFPFFWEDTGFHFFGGILAAIGVLALTCKRAGEHFVRWLDITLLTLTVVLLFHHLGTFASGLAYGSPTGLPWGVLFDNSESAVLTNLTVHPTQLYAALVTLVAFLVAAVFYKSSHTAGRTSIFILLVLFGGYFLIEFLRDDSAPMFGGLRVSQYFELVCIVGGILLLVRDYYHRHTKRHFDGDLAAANTTITSTNNHHHHA